MGRFHGNTQIHHRRLYRLSIENTFKIVLIACSKHAKYRISRIQTDNLWTTLNSSGFFFFVILFFYVIYLMWFVSHADIMIIIIVITNGTRMHYWQRCIKYVDWISGNAWPYNRIDRTFQMKYQNCMAYPQAINSYDEQRVVPSRLINWFKCIWMHLILGHYLLKRCIYTLFDIFTTIFVFKRAFISIRLFPSLLFNVSIEFLPNCDKITGWEERTKKKHII